MKLPAELRLAIYELTLDDMVEYTAPSNQSSSMVGSQMRPRGMLALLLTSKTIRAESGKALAPLWSACVEVMEQIVVQVESTKASRQEICFHLSRRPSFAVWTGASVTGVKEAKDALAQITSQLNDEYLRRRAMIAVQLALQRAADDSRL